MLLRIKKVNELGNVFASGEQHTSSSGKWDHVTCLREMKGRLPAAPHHSGSRRLLSAEQFAVQVHTAGSGEPRALSSEVPSIRHHQEHVQQQALLLSWGHVCHLGPGWHRARRLRGAPAARSWLLGLLGAPCGAEGDPCTATPPAGLLQPQLGPSQLGSWG